MIKLHVPGEDDSHGVPHDPAHAVHLREDIPEGHPAPRATLREKIRAASYAAIFAALTIGPLTYQMATETPEQAKARKAKAAAAAKNDDTHQPQVLPVTGHEFAPSMGGPFGQ